MQGEALSLNVDFKSHKGNGEADQCWMAKKTRTHGMKKFKHSEMVALVDYLNRVGEYDNMVIILQ